MGKKSRILCASRRATFAQEEGRKHRLIAASDGGRMQMAIHLERKKTRRRSDGQDSLLTRRGNQLLRCVCRCGRKSERGCARIGRKENTTRHRDAEGFNCSALISNKACERPAALRCAMGRKRGKKFGEGKEVQNNWSLSHSLRRESSMLLLFPREQKKGARKPIKQRR